MRRNSWTAGEMLAQAEGSIGSVLNTAVKNYYQGRDLDTAQTVRQAYSDTDAATIITAMRRGRWEDVAGVAGVATLGIVAGTFLQSWLNDPRVYRISPVALLGMITVAVGFAAPVGLPGRAALVAGGATYAVSAQLFGWRRP